MKKKKSLFKIILTTIKVFLFILIFAFVTSVLLQRFSNNELSLFNFRIFSVLTGSMEPKYNVGDVLISKEIDPADIKVGDSISYLGNSGSFKDKVVTHEVIGFVEENGERLYRTKGISNESEDPVVSADQIYGKIVYKTVVLSFVFKIVTTPFGMYFLVILPVLVVIGYTIIKKSISKESEKRKEVSYF